MSHIFSDPTFWVAVAFFGFIALVFYYKAPALVAKALDERAMRIKTELEEARKLRDDAQAILADYLKRQRNADQEAKEIIDLAEREARAFATEARATLKETLERRTRQAEEKIKRAEEQAVSEVRRLAAGIAITASRQLIIDHMPQAQAEKLVNNQIARLGRDLSSS